MIAMNTPAEVTSIKGINCISGIPQQLTISDGSVEQVGSIAKSDEELPLMGTGLIDLQVNGIDGVDFNNTSLHHKDVLKATQYLLSKGVTTFFPTLITNADDNVLKLLETLRLACEKYPLVEACVGGIHLEGPFISEVEGARGAHNLQYIKAPDWQWVQKCQEVSGGRVKLLTLSPEWEGTNELIRQCRQQGILVAIGHSFATPEQIQSAVKAGATLSTHLGNAIPLMLPRHPNLLWEQLAQDDLYASIIADGFHLPNAFLKVAIRAKGDKTILVSDATCFSGMTPGTYQTHIGDEVILEKGGRLAMKKSPDLLAGATKCLVEDVQYLLTQDLASLKTTWQMASTNPAAFLGKTEHRLLPGQPADIVLFHLTERKKIHITQVIKKGHTVFEL
uniref:Amidohydrolase family protein n=1 Tax=Roseihalotalea indica TaxID=2867963 RepID=A0AA49GP08_9BACT|nr:amidohydrolase family protein [Tunicatimonas sp. TK19036]